MASLISLGKVDKGALPADKSSFLSVFHASLADNLKQKLKFRDEGNNAWCDFEETEGSSVRELQQFLHDTGFMPKARMDGIFDYTTQAAVRLFQEYLRTVDGSTAIGTPDGVVGPNTFRHIEKWKQEKAGSDRFVSDWGKSGAQNPSAEFEQWIQLLDRAKNHFQANPSPLTQYMASFTQPTDTRRIDHWDTSRESIHLIGLRRGQEQFGGRRENDDLFVLLINGMVFKFWGSTDPNPDMSERHDIPFLVEGQHQYEFGWHKIGDEKTVYRALRPHSAGVLVFRDKNADRALTEADVVRGVDTSPNTTINIHWSGIGRANFSAGCQVIAGKSYINHHGQVVDCNAFAASSYGELGSSKTRGAYNVFTDLLLTYAAPGVHTIAYTLGRDETLRLSDALNAGFVEETVARMKR